ncbi:MAG TPA: hypothetical protein VEJ89_07585 [Myxococcaceae bacterium]|nr:hypothetical protein [Myxococcaceae bacterium]
MRLRVPILALLGLTLAGCGDLTSPVRSQTPRAALLQTPEQVELLAPGVRQELYRSLVRDSAQEQLGAADDALSLFPFVQNGELRCAPPLEGRGDLFEVPDAGDPASLVFEGEPWSDERRDSLQGLSEREAAELVARSLAGRWSLHPPGALRVYRADGVPYAAAYADGALRLNPVLLYLVAASEGR